MELIEAAITGFDGEVHFATGYERKWCGQTITTPGADFSPWGFGDTRIVPVRGVSLATVIRDRPAIDLIDMDIQGAEADVIEAALPLVRERVRRLYIETHNTEVETRIRLALRSLDFRCLWDFLCYQESGTPFGRVSFEGGVQVWVNPR